MTTSNFWFGQGNFSILIKLSDKYIYPDRDDLSHADEDIFSKEETLDTIRNISQELGSIGLPVYPSLGNHDIVPKNQVPHHDIKC